MAINIDKLMSGIGVVIDDALIEDGDETDDIYKIIEQFEEKNIPIIKYVRLPDESIQHFKNVSFILLDWNLGIIPLSTSEPVVAPARLKASYEKLNIEFIKNIKSVCFIPIFIFTNENVDKLKDKLIKAKLYSNEVQNFIFVLDKSEIRASGSLFPKLKTWLEETVSIYVLKEWENHLVVGKNKLFWDFYSLNPDWPKILWKAYKKDGVNMSNELGELISKNLLSVLSSYKFESDLLDYNGEHYTNDDFKKVLEGERFISNESLKIDEIYTGDIYRQTGKYYLNIRPQCDCIARDGEIIDDIMLYCLKGKKLTNRKVEILFEKDYGTIKERDTNCIIYPIDKGKAIEFKFKDLKIIKYQELKDCRIGRILSPFITKIQQKYTNYLHRPGLPRLPEEVIVTSTS